MSRLQRHTSIHEAPSLTVHLQTDLKEFLENDGYYLSKSNASFHIPYILIPLFFQTWHSFLFRFRIGSNPFTSIYSSAWTTSFFFGQDFLHWLIVGIIDWWFIIVPKLTYRNRAYRMPLLIRTPWGTFWAHNGRFWPKIVQKLCIFGRFSVKNYHCEQPETREF